MSYSSQLGYLQLGGGNLGSVFEGDDSPVLSRSVDDSLNNWADSLSTLSIIVGLRVSDTLTLTDVFSSRITGVQAADTLILSDSLAYDYLAPAFPLSVTIVDKFVRSGGVNGNNYSLRDGFSYVRGPSGPVFVSISDLGTFLDDSNLAIGYGIQVAD